MSAPTSIKRRRYANGPARPKYLQSQDADRAVMMILALAAEVSALRERLDTHERLADAAQSASIRAVESFEPDASVEAQRAAARRSLIDRVARVLIEPVAPRAAAKSIEES
jgi:hypothetical protein